MRCTGRTERGTWRRRPSADPARQHRRRTRHVARVWSQTSAGPDGRPGPMGERTFKDLAAHPRLARSARSRGSRLPRQVGRSRHRRGRVGCATTTPSTPGVQESRGNSTRDDSGRLHVVDRLRHASGPPAGDPDRSDGVAVARGHGGGRQRLVGRDLRDEHLPSVRAWPATRGLIGRGKRGGREAAVDRPRRGLGRRAPLAGRRALVRVTIGMFVASLAAGGTPCGCGLNDRSSSEVRVGGRYDVFDASGTVEEPPPFLLIVNTPTDDRRPGMATRWTTCSAR